MDQEVSLCIHQPCRGLEGSASSPRCAKLQAAINVGEAWSVLPHPVTHRRPSPLPALVLASGSNAAPLRRSPRCQPVCLRGPWSSGQLGFASPAPCWTSRQRLLQHLLNGSASPRRREPPARPLPAAPMGSRAGARAPLALARARLGAGPRQRAAS